RGEALQLQRRGQAGGVLDQRVVQEGGAHLERGGHRGPVHLGQQIVLQVEQEVGQEQRVQGLAHRHAPQHGAGVLQRIVGRLGARQRRQRLVGEQLLL